MRVCSVVKKLTKCFQQRFRLFFGHEVPGIPDDDGSDNLARKWLNEDFLVWSKRRLARNRKEWNRQFASLD
jgi:hypothetical protein